LFLIECLRGTNKVTHYFKKLFLPDRKKGKRRVKNPNNRSESGYGQKKKKKKLIHPQPDPGCKRRCREETKSIWGCRLRGEGKLPYRASYTGGKKTVGNQKKEKMGPRRLLTRRGGSKTFHGRREKIKQHSRNGQGGGAGAVAVRSKGGGGEWEGNVIPGKRRSGPQMKTCRSGGPPSQNRRGKKRYEA